MKSEIEWQTVDPDEIALFAICLFWSAELKVLWPFLYVLKGIVSSCRVVSSSDFQVPVPLEVVAGREFSS